MLGAVNGRMKNSLCCFPLQLNPNYYLIPSVGMCCFCANNGRPSIYNSHGNTMSSALIRVIHLVEPFKIDKKLFATCEPSHVIINVHCNGNLQRRGEKAAGDDTERQNHSSI